MRAPRSIPHGQYPRRLDVDAAALWAREFAKLAGIELPFMRTEHRYFVIQTNPEIAAMDRRLPSVADRDGDYYLRQEGKGLLVGAMKRT